MTKRGRILRDTNVGPGILTVDGKQYTFTLEQMWRSDVPPRTGMTIDATFTSDGALEAVSAVSEAQVAKEQAQKAISGALRQSEVMRGGVKTRFGLLNAALELLLLISFFALPSLLVGSVYSRRALTGWDTTGLDPRTTMANNHGLLSLLAVVCLLAPVAVPFLKQAWARWLYAVPLGFIVVAFVAIAAEIHSAASEVAGNMGTVLGNRAASAAQNEFTSMFSISLGTYLVFLFALALAWRARAGQRQAALA